MVSASFTAGSAGLCAGFAVLMFVFLAFLGTEIADFCAHSHQVFCDLAFFCQLGGNETADICAFPIKPYALRHHLHIVFFETGIEAVIACDHTILQGSHKFLIHDFPPYHVCYSDITKYRKKMLHGCGYCVRKRKIFRWKDQCFLKKTLV